MSSKTSKGAILGYRQDGTLGPGQKGVVIPAVFAEVSIQGAAVVKGEPVYCSMAATLASLSNTSTGDAIFYTGWVRSAPATAYAHTGMVGIVTEIISQPAGGPTIAVIQLQGVCEYALVDGATAANDSLAFDTAGELDVAAAEDGIVAYAITADVSNVAPVLLLGAFRGILGPFT